MDPNVLSPLPQVPTEAERRAAVLRRDPRALALMLAPDAGLRAAGMQLDQSQLQRSVEARQGLGAQFEQAMQRGQEERQRAFGGEELGLKGRQLGIEAGKLSLAQQQLELGRWMPIQGSDGITYLYDQKSKGFDLMFGTRLFGYWRFNATYTYSDTNVTFPEETTIDPMYQIMYGLGNYIQSSITPEIYRSTIDSPLTPSSGTMYMVSVKYAGTFLGGEVHIIKPTFMFTHYQPTFAKQSLGIHA